MDTTLHLEYAKTSGGTSAVQNVADYEYQQLPKYQFCLVVAGLAIVVVS